jgi:hypothetical protein
MARLRILIACLLMAALPLQGLAAVTMMLCGATVAAAGAAEHHHPGAGSAHRAGAAHGVPADAVHDASGHAGHGGHAGHAHGADADAAASSDAGHECGICGAGCHSVAIASSADPVPPALLPMAPRAAAAPPMHTRTTPVPERPPRA